MVMSCNDAHNNNSQTHLRGYCNTPVERTDTESQRALCDWFSCTCSLLGEQPEEVIVKIGLDPSDFEETTPQQGYTNAITFNHITLYYKQDNDTYHYWLNMSGQGCRYFEEYSSYDWIGFFKIMKDYYKSNITRIDLAIDDFSNTLEMSKIIYAAKKGNTKSRFRTFKTISNHQMSDGKELGSTIYFGSSKSDIQIRFYDKKAEREQNNKEVTCDTWVRCELQMRKARANSVVDLIIDNERVGSIALGVLKYYLMFLSPSKNDSNKRRWNTIKWWDKFLTDIEALSLSVKAPDRTIERAFNWASNQLAPTLATLEQAYGVDLLLQLLDEGKKRMNKNHIMMLKNYKKNHQPARTDENLSPFDFMD